MKALGRQANMEERDILRYVVKGITDDENTKLVLCSACDFEELQDKLGFIGGSLSAPVSGENQNDSEDDDEDEEGGRLGQVSFQEGRVVG